MKKKKIAIIGAGPGGLAAGMLLSSRGFDVSVYEKKPVIGGRNTAMHLGDYIFDTGPTFLMMTFILEDIFRSAGKKAGDYLTIRRLDPMYKLSFYDTDLYPVNNPAQMQAQIDRYFPGNENSLMKFYEHENIRYNKLYPCLQKDYSSPFSMISPSFLKALPYMSPGKSLYSSLGRYFNDDHLKIAFTFQSKYLGMSPWECPAVFTIIPFIEHKFGIDHVIGGLSEISEAFVKIIQENGGKIFISSPVRRILVKGRTACGIQLENNEKIDADAVIINADFGHAMTTLFDRGTLGKYRESRVKAMKYSCSAFMIYLGLDRIYNEPHHNIIFARDYHLNIDDIMTRGKPSDDMSVYIRNASITDTTLAPPGHSAIYILVPAPNTKGGFYWSESASRQYRNLVINRIKERTSMKDIDKHIVIEKIITPAHWENDFSVFYGATFNLSHSLGQMLWFRPHNRFEEIKKCYLAGGGTHPGSGLPAVLESGRIATRLITRDLK